MQRCVTGFAVWPQKGHIYPTFHLARMLREKGAEVIYFGSPSAESVVREQGFTFRAAGVDRDDAHFARKSYRDKSRFIRELVQDITVKIRADGVTQLFVDPLFDAVAIAGVLAEVDVKYFWVMNPPYCRGRHLPFAFMGLGRHLDLTGRSRLSPALRWLPQRLWWKWRALRHRIRMHIYPVYVRAAEVAAERKIKLVLTSYGPRFDLPAIVLGPKRFEQWPDQSLRYLGLGVDESRAEDAFIPPSSGPLVYVSLGTNFGLYSQASRIIQFVLEAAAQLPAIVFVIQVPAEAQPRFKAPANVTFVANASTLAVLRHASAAIIHGGYGSIKECILYQVPFLIVPFLFDQPSNAARVSDLGLGIVIAPSKADSARIREGLESLLNGPGFRSRIKTFRASTLAEDDYQRFCSEVVSGPRRPD